MKKITIIGVLLANLNFITISFADVIKGNVDLSLINDAKLNVMPLMDYDDDIITPKIIFTRCSALNSLIYDLALNSKDSSLKKQAPKYKEQYEIFTAGLAGVEMSSSNITDKDLIEKNIFKIIDNESQKLYDYSLSLKTKKNISFLDNRVVSNDISTCSKYFKDIKSKMAN